MTGRRSHGRLSALNGVVHQGSTEAATPSLRFCTLNCSTSADASNRNTSAGGYALNPDDTVEIHSNTVRAAKDVYLRATKHAGPL